ncbi:GNAT family N-acetyltransferase [Streptomyces tubbatahanensis]|uniref:GNAT family N-acetyltransferase n=1 Tax=Streptomyces tubbatahanensis TaxID=2923272 RepID=A0ABY3XQT8_9ACTN|nr:GNAT family N-acetyltransferase [Streptomyces tubbatahanensis]UNS96769.1 GNAT family N-acetyltransferase [Streptomyces tubbatahanensis]
MSSSASPAQPTPPAHADVLTERLALRPWTTAETAAVLDGTRLAHWAHDFPADGDRVIAGFLGEHPAWRGAHGHRLVVERESGLVVGSIGLFWPPSEGAVEIGYGIVASRRGRGYAPEAVRALAGFAFTAPEVHTVCARVEGANSPSVRVLEKAGFSRWDDGDGEGVGVGGEGVVRFGVAVTDVDRSRW